MKTPITAEYSRDWKLRLFRARIAMQAIIADMDTTPVRHGDFLVTQHIFNPWQVDGNRIYRVGNQNIAAMINQNTKEQAVLITEAGPNGFKRFIKHMSIVDYLSVQLAHTGPIEIK